MVVAMCRTVRSDVSISRKFRSAKLQFCGKAEALHSLNMADLKDPRLIYLKAGLFLLIGLVSVGLILIEHPSLKIFCLLLLAIWAFSRLYYFMFYVIEKYVDGQYKFSGVMSFVRYVMSRNK